MSYKAIKDLLLETSHEVESFRKREYVFEQIMKNRHLFDEASLGHSLDYIKRLRRNFK
nr:zincin-like metallopeptidase toxin domain-containing protein [Paenibacillus woosongensis]